MQKIKKEKALKKQVDEENKEQILLSEQQINLLEKHRKLLEKANKIKKQENEDLQKKILKMEQLNQELERKKEKLSHNEKKENLPVMDQKNLKMEKLNQELGRQQKILEEAKNNDKILTQKINKNQANTKKGQGRYKAINNKELEKNEDEIFASINKLHNRLKKKYNSSNMKMKMINGTKHFIEFMNKLESLKKKIEIVKEIDIKKKIILSDNKKQIRQYLLQQKNSTKANNINLSLSTNMNKMNKNKRNNNTNLAQNKTSKFNINKAEYKTESYNNSIKKPKPRFKQENHDLSK